MSDLTIFGQTFTDVKGIKATDTDGNEVVYGEGNIDLSSQDLWEVGAVNGTLSRTYYANQSTNTARLRLIYPAYIKGHSYTFHMEFGTEWQAQYALYGSDGKSNTQFVTMTSDTVITSGQPYIAIVLWHRDGTTAMSLDDVATMQPKLIY